MSSARANIPSSPLRPESCRAAASTSSRPAAGTHATGAMYPARPVRVSRPPGTSTASHAAVSSASTFPARASPTSLVRATWDSRPSWERRSYASCASALRVGTANRASGGVSRGVKGIGSGIEGIGRARGAVLGMMGSPERHDRARGVAARPGPTDAVGPPLKRRHAGGEEARSSPPLAGQSAAFSCAGPTACRCRCPPGRLNSGMAFPPPRNMISVRYLNSPFDSSTRCSGSVSRAPRLYFRA